MREYLARCQQEHGLAIGFTADEGERLPASVETALFRIAQEALNNVVRHAQAHRVDVALVRDEAYATLRVADDGQGFDPQASRSAMHLERVEQLGGQIEVQSAPGRGTVLVARVPIQAEAVRTWTRSVS